MEKDLKSHLEESWKTAHDIVPNLSTANHRARAYRATDLTPTYDVWTTMVLDTESSDPNGNFAANAYTCPVSGRYQVQAGINFRHNSADTDAVMSAAIYNGANRVARVGKVCSFFANGDQYHGFAGGDEVECAAGDIITLKYLAIGWNVNFVGGSDCVFLSIHRIS